MIEETWAWTSYLATLEAARECEGNGALQELKERLEELEWAVRSGSMPGGKDLFPNGIQECGFEGQVVRRHVEGS